MSARVVSGTANRELAEAVAACLGVAAVVPKVERFPDGELRPAVAELRGEDVFIVQPTGPMVNEHLVELLLVLDACRRAGAARITAVVPYLGYARQDRRATAGEAVGLRVVTDVIAVAGAHRLMVVDPHSAALEAACSIPVEMLTAVPTLAAALLPMVGGDAVVVAPDLGATKLAERYASILRRPVAVVRKTRLSGTSVRAHELVGDVGDRPVALVDDMISTGSTVEAAARLLGHQARSGQLFVAATHGPLVAGAIERMAAAGVARAFVTDTVRVATGGVAEVCSVAGVLAEAIGRLHWDRPLDELLMRS